MASGKWEVASGEWQVGSGKWLVGVASRKSQLGRGDLTGVSGFYFSSFSNLFGSCLLFLFFIPSVQNHLHQTIPYHSVLNAGSPVKP